MPEITSNIVSCPICKQLYDASRFSVCPYCHGQPMTAPVLDYGSGFSPTQDIAFQPGGQGNFGATQDPYGEGTTPLGGAGWQVPTFDPSVRPDAGQNDRMKHTQVVDGGNAAGAPLPVVGWLVAIDGPCKGTDYRIHTGYNYIGREYGDICIRGDMTISAEKDANVTYVPQSNRFYIAHEQGKNVLLVNDIPAIGGGTELHNYDRITVGTTQLLFVGLCGEQFSWTKRKEQGNG